MEANTRALQHTCFALQEQQNITERDSVNWFFAYANNWYEGRAHIRCSDLWRRIWWWVQRHVIVSRSFRAFLMSFDAWMKQRQIIYSSWSITIHTSHVSEHVLAQDFTWLISQLSCCMGGYCWIPIEEQHIFFRLP
jgi:hypothetical protein